MAHRETEREQERESERERKRVVLILSSLASGVWLWHVECGKHNNRILPTDCASVCCWQGCVCAHIETVASARCDATRRRRAKPEYS